MDDRLHRALGVFVIVACALSCAGEPGPAEETLVAAVGSGDNERLRALLAAGLDPNRSEESAPAPLALAAARSNLVAVKMLIEAGADPSGLPGILTVPAMRDDVTMLEVLLEAGADLESEDHLRQTAVEAAVDRGSGSAVSFLLDHGANPDGRPGRGERPLLVAIKRDSRELIELLVGAGAKVDVVGGSPITTPLILAAQRGQTETVEYLLAHGADPARAVSGQNATAAARRAGHEELATLLERALAN
jgi:ankyrin repeat protein